MKNVVWGGVFWLMGEYGVWFSVLLVCSFLGVWYSFVVW